MGLSENALRVRIAELEEELRQAKERMAPSDIMFPAEWGLSPGQHRALLALYCAPGGFLSHENLYTAVAMREGGSAPQELTSQYVFHLRRALDGRGIQGIEIVSRREFGYELTSASRHLIRTALQKKEI